jgi:hypothetical protein
MYRPLAIPEATAGAHVEACCTSGSSPPPRLVLSDAARARVEAWIAAGARRQFGAGVAVTVTEREASQ